MSKHFYVYYSYEEFGRGYIGSRGCKCLPEEDFKYYGSFRDKNFNPTQKIILGVYESRKDAYEAEILLHEFYDVARNPHFANRSKMLTTGFSVEGVPIGKGKILSEEHKRKIRESNIGKKRSIEIRKRPEGSFFIYRYRSSRARGFFRNVSRASRNAKEHYGRRIPDSRRCRRCLDQSEWSPIPSLEPSI